MLNQNITITAEDLNLGTEIVNTIGNNVLDPNIVKVVNGSGADLEFGLFTDSEYEAYQADAGVTDLFMVYGGEQRVMNDLRFITTLVVKGTQVTADDHSESVTFEVIK